MISSYRNYNKINIYQLECKSVPTDFNENIFQICPITNKRYNFTVYRFLLFKLDDTLCVNPENERGASNPIT